MKFTGWKEVVLGLVCTIAAFCIGMFCPLVTTKVNWTYIVFAYIFLAAVLPMWILMQPRDYMTTFMFAGMIIGAVVGLVVAHPTMNLPMYTGFHNEKSGAAASADGTAATGTPFAIFSSGVAGFLEMFGIPVYVAQCFMTMCVSALALTSLDSVARIGRMSFQELFSVDDMEHAEGWRKVLCNKYFATVITLACGYVLTQIGYSNIWRSLVAQTSC